MYAWCSTAAARFSAQLAVGRQAVVNTVLSALYGRRVQVMPAGTMGVAGAIVFWYLQDGFKQFLMVRNDKGDTRARFISCLGLTGNPDMPSALHNVLEAQFGKIFAQTVEAKSLAVDRVAAAPTFTYIDETTGVVTPVQALVWCVQLQQAQIDLIITSPGFSAMIVPEFGMSSSKVSPTHRSLWQAAGRHVPASKRKAGEGLAENTDDMVQDLSEIPPTRVLN